MKVAAILIAPGGAGGPLRGLMDRLVSVGVIVTIVDEIGAAADLFDHHEDPPAVLLDMRELGAGEVEDMRRGTDFVRRTIAAIPHAQPVAVTADASTQLILALLRAGAGDVIDLALEGAATARAVVQRICHRQRDRAFELEVVERQRQIIEELLKDLIRTERRTIDVEEALAAARTGELASGESRAPAILLIEHERAVADDLADLLEAAGVATYAYVTGEEALREARTLAETTGLDLALVAAQLPGIDGLETVRKLRDRIPGLPAFLMTAVSDGDLAAQAADLGVVGFVEKPLDHADEVVERLTQLAHESLQRTREHVYLMRIKERHERVLEQYRSLPREP
ncbi:MAG: response regulator [Deltaproteobacteria bacterium]|nr:response regulator [Deltaproteobacteria bacterium]